VTLYDTARHFMSLQTLYVTAVTLYDTARHFMSLQTLYFTVDTLCHCSDTV